MIPNAGIPSVSFLLFNRHTSCHSAAQHSSILFKGETVLAKFLCHGLKSFPGSTMRSLRSSNHHGFESLKVLIGPKVWRWTRAEHGQILYSYAYSLARHCLHYLWELRANCELMRAHIRAAVLEDSSQTAVPRVPKNEEN